MGAARIAAGALLVAAAKAAWSWWGSPIATAALLLVGLSLVLHFGLCNVVAAGWRRLGIDCGPLFRAPARSRSLEEFWGRRWNLAFSEMAAAAVYRPLSPWIGRGAALYAVFLLSGLLHEVAITVPVRAGHGGPAIYFALHGALVLIERALARRGRPIGGVFGRAWTAVWLIAPLPLLFHPPFVRATLWPLIGITVGGR
jgi:alginate O-acetyltransferase complex protein AlgI